MGNEHGVGGTLKAVTRSRAVFAELADLRQRFGAYAASFDPGLVTPSEASLVADEAAKIEAIAAVVRGLAASRGRDRTTDVEPVIGR